MKIVVANYRFYITGGPERYMFNFIDLARNHGVEIVPFSVKSDKNVFTEYESFFISPLLGSGSIQYEDVTRGFFRKTKIAIRAIYNLEAKRKLRRLLKIVQPDLLYVIHQINVLSPSIFSVAKAMRIPVIHRISDFNLVCAKNVLNRNGEICEKCLHGSNCHAVKYKCVKGSFSGSFLRAFSMSIHKFFGLYNPVNAFIAPAKFTMDKLIESERIEAGKIVNIPTFIDIAQIKPNYGHKGYVLCLGRLSEEKGFFYAAEAMKYLKDLPVKLIITGTLNDKEIGLKNLIFTNDLSDKVVFTGFLNGDELKNLLDNAMCIACPAIWYENMPNAVLEAYAYGKPVIASNIGCFNEIIEHEKTGYLFDMKNTVQIAKLIRKLYMDRDLVVAMGKNARQKCETEFSPELHWNRFINLYKSIKEKNI